MISGPRSPMKLLMLRAPVRRRALGKYLAEVCVEPRH